MEPMLNEEFTKHDWAHLHDCILTLTWNTTKKNCSQEELEEIFNSLPSFLKTEAYEWGMSDTLWRDNFMDYYKNLIK